MPKTILPPAAETFLSAQTGNKLSSSMRDVYENIMVNTAVSDYLTQLGIDFAVNRPPAIFNDDDLWRAIVKNVAYGPRHTRYAVARFVELILGPKVSQVTTLQRTHYKQIKVGDTLNVTNVPATANNGAYTVAEILTHHLIFPSGTFASVPEEGTRYDITNLYSTYGNIVKLSDGREALVDNTVSFVNTHEEDFLTKLNIDIPQYGKIIFNKNSSNASKVEETFNYNFYDRSLSGILKLASLGTMPGITHNKYSPIRSTRLSATSLGGSLTLSLLDSTNFPKSDAPVPTINTSDVIQVIPPGSTYASGNLVITSVSANRITVDPGTPFPVIPANPTTTDIIYQITTPAYAGPPVAHPGGSLDNGRGYFVSRKGRIINATTLVDYTVDFTEGIKPYTDGSVATGVGKADVSEPFSVTINRGGNNEETVEVLYRATNVLHLVADPKDSTGATSLLKFDHFKGEEIEVFNAATSATGTYFPLNAAGDTTGTADAGSTDVLLIDASATFVDQNADANYGDELEVTADPTGSNKDVRRTITAKVGANLQVGIAFPSPLAGCTYRIRKLYKPLPSATAVPGNEDQFLYVNDSSIFPFADPTASPPGGFSVILDKGTSQEEVVWITENHLLQNRLRVGNSDWGTPGSAVPYLSKKHNFGMTVEAAQLLVESCNWEIIETKATGEFTIAYEKECVPEVGLHGWYLHENTPHPLLYSSTFASSAPVPGTGGIPVAPIATNAAAGDTKVDISLDNYLRVFANPRATNFLSEKRPPDLIFRPGLLTDTGGSGNTEEVFITNTTDIGKLANNIITSSLKIVMTKSYPALTTLRLGDYNSKYPGQVETVQLTVAGSTLNPDTGYYEATLSGFTTYNHFPGESISPLTISLNVRSALTKPFLSASTQFCLLTAHPGYLHTDVFSNGNVFTATGGSTTTIEWDAGPVPIGPHLSQDLVGMEVYVQSAGGAAPERESRRIIAVVGPYSTVLMVNPPFSSAVAAGDTFYIQPTAQSGDITDASVVPLGDVNAAFPAALNTVNLNKWAGGHRSIFPGSYMFRKLDIYEEPVDQPTSTVAWTLSSPSVVDPTAIYKFPGPKRLIAEPVLPCASIDPLVPSSQSIIGVQVGDAAAIEAKIANGTTITDCSVEILGPSISLDWRTTRRISNWDLGTRQLTVSPAFISFPGTVTVYRILGDPNETALSAGVSPSMWVDYPDLFPDAAQGDFHVTVDRVNGGEDIKITSCQNILPSAPVAPGNLYGKFVVDAVESVSSNYPSGTTVELKVNKFALDSTATGLLSGGFYLEFGFQKELVKDVDVGLGDLNINESTDKVIAGVHHPGEYVHNKDAITSVQNGKYFIPKGGLKQSSDSLSSPIIRASIASVISNVAAECVLTLNDTNFDQVVHKHYRDLEGAPVLTRFSSLAAGDTLVYRIQAIDPVTNQIAIAPGVTSGGVLLGAPALVGSPLEIHPQNTRVDDQERFDMGPSLLQLAGTTAPADVTTGPITNDYRCISVVGPASPSVIEVSPGSAFTTLIGRKVVVVGESPGPGPKIGLGEESTIVDVDVDSSIAYDRIIVSPPFSNNVAVDLRISVFLEDSFAPRFRSRAGGVRTGINDFYGAPWTPPTTSRFPAGREYGIVEEYVEYLSENNSIYTTPSTYYFMYDHPPSTKVTIGSGETTTQGFGKDYRPYLMEDYLAIIFNSEIVDIKNLFCAAGIQCKTETTELGS